LPDNQRFAHPAEAEFAALLSFYAIRWAYEPTTFAVRWDDEGWPHEFVTPDFFLPDHDLYIELTSMRQRLVTRKNRKFRLLRESYPNVQVRMLYLRDLERIRRCYGARGPELPGRLGSTVVSDGEVTARIEELVDELDNGSLGPDAHAAPGCERPLLLGVGAGSERFLISLAAGLESRGRAVDRARIDLTSYLGAAGEGHIRVTHGPVRSVAGRSVIIVQEVLSSGLSATFLQRWLRRRGASDIAVCALLDREAARIVDVPLTCRGFAAPDVGLAGFGLCRWQEHRDLPFIAEVEAS
jgi:hypoxanthine phosphoribosyltransferase